MQSRPRVVVGMSGGVDSSVAAGLLVEQGYDVIGITLKTYNYDEVGGNAGNESSCCSLDGINDARIVCMDLGIPHYVLDFSSTFEEHVINPFVEEYLAGNTPNPCVLCNKKIKWEELIAKGLGIGADYVAMGHYARLVSDEKSGRHWISRGRDPEKDQSYALWAISQEHLARTIFPLSGFRKDEARAWAERNGIRTANKHESYEICFIPDDNYGRFLRDRIPDLEERMSGGEIHSGGKTVGRHKGYPFYTIGQRRGLHLSLGKPVFITSIDAKTNTIEVGGEEQLFHSRFSVHSINMQKYDYPTEALRVVAKIRYKDRGAPAALLPRNDGTLIVQFDEPRRAITPGQSTVWYDGDDLVGGGIIKKVLT